MYVHHKEKIICDRSWVTSKSVFPRYIHTKRYRMDQTQRFRAFLLGCIPARILLALIPLYLDQNWLPYYGIVIFAISMSFLYLYFLHLRQNAFEGGGSTWWSQFRLIHGALFLTASIYLFQKKTTASLPLFIDTALGLGLFIKQHME